MKFFEPSVIVVLAFASFFWIAVLDDDWPPAAGGRRALRVVAAAGGEAGGGREEGDGGQGARGAAQTVAARAGAAARWLGDGLGHPRLLVWVGSVSSGAGVRRSRRRSPRQGFGRHGALGDRERELGEQGEARDDDRGAEPARVAVDAGRDDRIAEREDARERRDGGRRDDVHRGRAQAPKIEASASGSSTWRMIWRSVRPWPRAASTRSRSTAATPT